MTHKPKDSRGFLRILLQAAAWPLALLALCTGIFALVLALHLVPAQPALYAGALCLVLLAVLSAVRFFTLRGRHRTLKTLRGGLPDTLAHLPPPRHVLEEDYQVLLTGLSRIHARRISEDDQRYLKMTEYYTLWSHQIKTPLAAMRLLLNTQDDQRGRQLQAELQKTEHYVDMALNYMRLDSPESDYRFEPVALQDAAAQAARRYAGQFVLKRLAFSNQVPEDVAMTSDRKWLVFVLEQLLSNAIKYTHVGGVTISWDGATRSLVVADTGIGIPPEDLPRVFEQGFTGYTGRVEQQATGIGLYLCREVCRRLGHSLAIQSQPGQGTQVMIRFQPAPR